MKKIFAIALVIVMMAAISIPAFAAEVVGSDTGALSNKTEIEYGVDQTYTVTIPDKIDIDVNRNGTGTVKVENACIPAGTKIKVSVNSDNTPANDSQNTWELWDAATSGTKAQPVGYTISVDSQALTRGATFLQAPSAVTFTAVEKTLNIAVNKTMQVATYKDFLTFSVAIAA